MVNNTRNDSGGSRKGLKGMFQSRSIPTADIKKKITDLSGKTMNIFQSRPEASKEEPKDYVVGERRLDSYGYEKINAGEDASEIFIIKRSDRALFDDADFSVCKPMWQEPQAAAEPVPVKTAAPGAPASDRRTLAEIIAGTSGQRKIEVSSGVFGQDSAPAESATDCTAGSNIISKVTSGYRGDNVSAKVSHVEFMDDDAVAESVADAPANAAAETEAVIEAVPEAVAEFDPTDIVCPGMQAEGQAAEPELQAADAPPVEGDDYEWIGLEELTSSAGEASLEEEEVPAADAAEEPAEDAPADIITAVPKAPEKIDVAGIEGLQMDGARESDASSSEPGVAIVESLQTAETSGAAVEKQNPCMAALTPDGEGRKVLSDPCVKRPRSRTMRFKNGQLCNNTEPQEELRRPLE